MIALDLRDNQLSGEILRGLVDVSHLLGNNNWSGEIPPELGGLANLESLDLSGNQLRGEIPPELGGLANLAYRWTSATTG